MRVAIVHEAEILVMSRGNISSLGDLKKREEGNAGGASGGEPGDEYYSGGNDNRGGGSGLNVLDPNSDMDRSN